MIYQVLPGSDPISMCCFFCSKFLVGWLPANIHKPSPIPLLFLLIEFNSWQKIWSCCRLNLQSLHKTFSRYSLTEAGRIRRISLTDLTDEERESSRHFFYRFASDLRFAMNKTDRSTFSERIDTMDFHTRWGLLDR